MLMNPWPLLAAALMLSGCASSAPRESRPAHSSAPDALLPSGRNLFAFDFAQARYQKLAFSRGAPDSTGVCRALDSLRAGWPRPSEWLALPAPGRPFSPRLAVWGPSGNFYILDRSGRRLDLYDSNAQFLSGIPLPPELRDRNLEAFQVFWTRDGTFSFLDLGEGKAWQYTEIRSVGGGDWRLKNTVRLPVGLETCLWEPWFRAPCCLAADGRGRCFDVYFNPVGPWPGPAAGTGIRPAPGPGAGEWSLIFDGGPACAAPPACFQPGKGLTATCPSETEAAPPK